ncbi:MAG: DUF2791 family P-loop domain-containing protein [Candidatus Methanomethylicaceae archaeon]
MSGDIDSFVAKKIIQQIGSSGTPPDYGVELFTAGIGSYLNVLEEEYFSSYLKSGGASFKMVIGVYGGGKTHFLFCVRNLAWKHNFVVSYVSLSPGQSPFHHLELVYRAIARGIMPPLSPSELLSGYEVGFPSFLRTWYAQKYREITSGSNLSDNDIEKLLASVSESVAGIESISFQNAIKHAYHALLDHDDEKFNKMCQWLYGEGYSSNIYSKYGIFQKIDKTTAFQMLRSLSQFVRGIGYSGIVILLDEAERVPSLSTKQKDQHLSNLRELIDECGHARFQGAMIFYAVPDESILEGHTQIYEALRQRVATIFNTLNPTGVRIDLEKVDYDDPIELMCEIGEKLRYVYQAAYNVQFDTENAKKTISEIAKASYEHRYGDVGYKRLFVQKLIEGFHYLKQNSTSPSAEVLGL